MHRGRRGPAPRRGGTGGPGKEEAAVVMHMHEGNPKLVTLLKEMIEKEGSIPFAVYMDYAIHHPEHGYYAKPDPIIGEEGDFLTSPALHPAFGRTMWKQIGELLSIVGVPKAAAGARTGRAAGSGRAGGTRGKSPRRTPHRAAGQGGAFTRWLRRLGGGGTRESGRPGPAGGSAGSAGEKPVYHVLEIGAGAGQLARDILTAWQEQKDEAGDQGDGGAPDVVYTILEQSRRLRKVQRDLLKKHVPGARVQWAANLKDLADKGGLGRYHVIVSNELMSAFPVHRLVWTGHDPSDGGEPAGGTAPPRGKAGGGKAGKGKQTARNRGAAAGSWQELRVTFADGRFQYTKGDVSEPKALEALEKSGVEPQPGQVYDVNVGAAGFLKQLVHFLAPRSFVLTVDYGGPARLVYAPGRTDGSLRCYYRGELLHDPFRRPGVQDMTADLDFDSVARAGREDRLWDLGLVQQGVFLTNLGIEETARALARKAIKGDLEADDELQRVYALYAPEALGESFWVMIQGKGFRRPPRITGLKTPAGPPASLAELFFGEQD